MDGNPRTLAEWQSYVQSLSVHDLFEAAEGAATVKFGQTLLAEGYTAMDIQAVLGFFARRFQSLGQEPPSWRPGWTVDYRSLLTA